MSMIEGARVVVNVCLGVKPNEKVLVLTDTGRNLSVAQRFFDAALEAGAKPALIIMSQRKGPGMEPPPHIAAAMKASDVIISPTTFTMWHTKARAEAVKIGARFASLSGCTPETLASEAMKADFVRQKPIAEKLANLMSEAKTIRFITPMGTDIKANITNRTPMPQIPIALEHGECAGPPNIETSISPVEGSAEGVIVIDGSVSALPDTILLEPVKLKVSKGKVIEVSGGEEAIRLEKLLQETNDPNVYVIAEFGIGLNPKARVCGVTIEDEGALGTAHIGIGDNQAFKEGKNIACMHIDLIMFKPIVELDGKIVFKEDHLV